MKRRDELKELRGASAEDLAKKLDEKEHELMNLRFRHASGQLQHSAQLKSLRKSIARVQTVLKQMERR